jgi:hypothetical protein
VVLHLQYPPPRTDKTGTSLRLGFRVKSVLEIGATGSPRHSSRARKLRQVPVYEPRRSHEAVGHLGQGIELGVSFNETGRIEAPIDALKRHLRRYGDAESFQGAVLRDNR